MEKPTYRIAHLSDLHLTARDSDRRSEPKLFGPLRGMNAAFRRVVQAPEIREADLVLITGDVTDRGAPEAWAIFRQALAGTPLADRVLIVPGNHDVCCLGLARLAKPGDQARRDLRKAVEAAGFDKFPWVVHPVPELAIFGLNSNNLGNLTVATNARGDVDYYQLERFARLLFKYRDVPVKIVALHHSPNIPGPSAAEKRDLKRFSRLEVAGHQIPQHQRQALRLLCLSHRVRLIVHGHLHRVEDRRVAGIRTIGAPATTEPCSIDGGPAGYRFFSYALHRPSGRVKLKLESVIM